MVCVVVDEGEKYHLKILVKFIEMHIRKFAF